MSRPRTPRTPLILTEPQLELLLEVVDIPPRLRSELASGGAAHHGLTKAALAKLSERTKRVVEQPGPGSKRLKAVLKRIQEAGDSLQVSRNEVEPQSRRRNAASRDNHSTSRRGNHGKAPAAPALKAKAIRESELAATLVSQRNDSTRPYTYLQRRVERFLDLLAAEQFSFSSVESVETRAEFHRELFAMRRDDNGDLDIESVGPLVRSLSKAAYTISQSTNYDRVGQTASPACTSEALVEMQRRYFNILDQFFLLATGRRRSSFSSWVEMKEHVLANAESRHRRADPFAWLEGQLRPYYAAANESLYSTCRSLGGVKLVLGGGSTFGGSHLNAVRKMLLYADTVLVPDPVLPWIELERTDERFRMVRLLEAVFELLPLKPLVDADLPFPAVAVFPSWEKLLETHDDTTQDGISRLYLGFFSHFCKASFDDEMELHNWIHRDPERFLRVVRQEGLFLGPGGQPGQGLEDAIEAQLNYVRTMRSVKQSELFEGLPSHTVVFVGMLERLSHQFHLRDNALALGAQPMLCLPAQEHYFSLCAAVFEKRLAAHKLLKKSTVSAIRALSNPTFRWLGNVPIPDLVRLREENANAEFRNRLSGFASELSEAALDDLDRVTSEISHELAVLLSEHPKDIKRIMAKYRRKHTASAVANWVTLAAQFLPWLAPVASVLAVPSAGKYVRDKIAEYRDCRESQQSLTGVLASAKRSG